MHLVAQLKEHKILFSMLTALVCLFILLVIGDFLGRAMTTAEGSNQLIAMATLIVAIANVFLVIVTLALAVGTYISIQYTQKANERVEKRFAAENKPLIDVVPTKVSPMRERPFVKIYFDLFNYSGFKALNVYIDVKYSVNDWISEWLNAARDRNRRQKTTVPNRDGDVVYWVLPDTVLELDPGQSIQNQWVRGSLDLEGTVCTGENRSDGLQILFRVRWQNEFGYRFDEIRKFRLLCTSVGEGRSYTLIPRGTLSRKEF